VKIGIVLPIEDEGQGAVPYSVIREMAQGAEAGGLDSVWVYDHLLFRFGDDPTTGLYECWTVLSAVAEATTRVELGTIVVCTAFRNPAVLAKMAGTLDAISGGRLILGIGAGWHDPEFEAFGFPTDHKVGRFEEALSVITSLIREGRADLDGQYVTVRDVVLVPPARPDIPILIAAKKPRMFDLTARHADAWNMAWFGLPDERLAGGRAGLAEACDRAGRDPSTLAITVGIEVRYPELGPTPPAVPGRALEGSPEVVAAGLAAHEALGADHLIVALDPNTPAALARFLDAVAAYRGAGEAMPA
jgi:alkanesulfonate monooxygenase SsuD/methylene tetrahydromethanopterin reductase-like flavin-dependent oxidoreductase (luciferase family)